MSRPPTDGDIAVLSAHPLADSAHLLALLDDTERDRAGRYRHRADRERFVTAHALARLMLATETGQDAAGLRFTTCCRRCGGPHGKPTLHGGPEFSLSHAGERVLVALSRLGAVGVDVEVVTGAGFDEVDAIALSGAEQAVIAALPMPRRAAARARYWVRKEAALKCTGDGLAIEPSRVAVSGPDDPAALLDTGWIRLPGTPIAPPMYLSDLPAGNGYAAAVAVLSERPPRITVGSADAMLSGTAAWAVRARTARR